MFVVLSCGSEAESEQAGPASRQQPRATYVDAYVVMPNELERSIQSTGSVIADESLEIRPERSGKLIMLDAPESAYIKAGHLIGKIDDTELVAQRDKLFSTLAFAQSELSRSKSLLAIQGTTEEEVARLSNEVKTTEADIKILDVQIQKSEIRAPFPGRLGLRRLSEGAYITPSDVIIDLQQTYRVKLDFAVPERFLNDVKRNQSVSFQIAGSDQTYHARVYAFSNEISPSTRTFTVRAVADNPGGKLKPGQFSKVNLVTGMNDQAILIPTDAVIPVLDGKQVFVAQKGRAVAKYIETDLRKEQLVEVTSGLNLGDTVIVSALLSISDGAPIQIGNLINTPKIID